MSLLEHPKAQALLADAEVSAQDVRGCRRRLERFLQRYLPRFYRHEQRELAQVVLQGKLSQLQRKTCEPIAYLADRQRKPLQHFVGAGLWDDEAVMAELRRHVAQEFADADAVLVLDGSGFPKKGSASCGVARQWCGRLGKVENCQVGVFLSYVTAAGYAPVDRQLYLPKDWAEDDKRRQQTHVAESVTFQESWRIGRTLLERSAQALPFGWIAGDDEFGRCSALRAALRQRGWRYVLDVPCNTLIRDLNEEPALGCRVPPWRRVEDWVKASAVRALASLGAGRWRQGAEGAACLAVDGADPGLGRPRRDLGEVGG
ncbi:MAG: IS701 family transposase, partial [Candidatus Dormibacteria bacterium]